MYYDDFKKVSNGASKKVDFMNKSILGYGVSSILAGIYIGLAVILVNTIGGALPSGAAKILMGAGFSLGLCLVVIGGAELFTGNVFSMTSGILDNTINAFNGIKLLVICYIGNFVGSIITALLFYAGGGLKSENIALFINNSSLSKMSMSGTDIFFKAILCNMLVCLAVWCATRCKSESGKIMMIFLCIFAFVVSGFEHCIANMTLMTASMLSPFAEGVTLSGFLHNIIFSTLGNIVGGSVFVALPYFIISKYR